MSVTTKVLEEFSPVCSFSFPGYIFYAFDSILCYLSFIVLWIANYLLTNVTHALLILTSKGWVLSDLTEMEDREEG